MIISKVMSSITTTLQSQLNSVVTKYITSPTHKQPAELLGNLTNLWKSNVCTQITILATQVALDSLLSKAIENSQKLTEFLSDLNSLLSNISDLVRGNSSGISLEGLSESISQSLVNMDSNVAMKASVSNVSAAVDSALNSNVFEEISQVPYGISKYQLIKLQNLKLVLLNFQLKVQKILELDSNLAGFKDSFDWQSMLHYDWSSREEKVTISILGTGMGYGNQYMGSSCRLVLTPLLERTLYTLLRATKGGGGALLTGEEVGACSVVLKQIHMYADIQI